MKLEERIILFSKLGTQISEQLESEELEEILYTAKSKNAWFTLDNIKNSLKNIINLYLNEQKLREFVSRYPEIYFETNSPKKVGIIAAGNLPLVGFQDLIHVILSGNIAYYKPSSQDEVLINYFYSILKAINPEIEKYFMLMERMNDVDAIIATGSENSSRYFEFYFGSKPHIIRKNRNSIAILDGKESKIDLANLANDIFEYFGLGCRNISKLYVPADYNFDFFFESIEYWNSIRMHSKYNNNYDYMKSIYLVNREPHLDNGFLLLKEDPSLSSPISVLYYESYETIESIDLKSLDDKLQVIVSNNEKIKNALPFGKSQTPELYDYADEVDTIEFLHNLKSV